jgi:hypothetical protein
MNVYGKNMEIPDNWLAMVTAIVYMGKTIALKSVQKIFAKEIWDVYNLK